MSRTPAERSADSLATEARKLRAISHPSREQRARLWEIENRKLPAAWRQLPPRQDSLDDQLRTLYTVANRLGCYDAADWIKARMLREEL